jgi:DNA polymerase-3 subunit delta
MAQDEALRERKDAILNQYNKTIDQNAYQAMCEMTGFDLRTFSHNLEKLISYVGERNTITVDDVRSVLKRTKKNPIYELTNAISERNIQTSIFIVNSLLADNLHPLQILAALTNQVRKLLMAKGFTESSQGGNWHAGIRYGEFKRNIMAAIQAYDRSLVDQLQSWESTILKKSDTADQGSGAKTKKKKGKPKTDLTIVKNPNNPYPVFQLLQSSEKYTTDELIAAHECLSHADMQLKSTGLRPKLILERAVISICNRN